VSRVIVVSVLLSLGAGPALAGEPARTVASAPPARAAAEQQTDERFAREASLAGLFDLKAAELALERANDPDVRKLAREIVEAQTLANARLQAFAPTAVASDLTGEHAARLERLRQAKADEFDATFLAAQSEAYARSVAMFEDYASSGADETLRAYASETLAVLKPHQSRVESLK
jgi:putative membrane protein